jgi:uncharacterized membrane protein HdeD (DUF308 family)
MIILGIIMLRFTFSSILAVELLLGLVLILLGIQMLTSGSTLLGEYRKTWWVIILGVLMIILGILAFIFPVIMLVYIMYLIAFTTLISGFTDLALAVMNKCGETNRVLIAITGILGVLLGILFLWNPFESAFVLAQVTGIFLLAFGLIAAVEAFTVRKAVPEIA